jgi:hypothetical protein
MLCQGIFSVTALADIQLDTLTAKVVESVPEPSTLALFGLGLAAVAIARRNFPRRHFRDAAPGARRTN